METDLSFMVSNYRPYHSKTASCTEGISAQVVKCEQTSPRAVEITLNTLCACALPGCLSLLDGSACVHATLPARHSGPAGTVKFLVWPSPEGTSYRFTRPCALWTGEDRVNFTVCRHNLAVVTNQTSELVTIEARTTRYEFSDFALRAGNNSTPTPLLRFLFVHHLLFAFFPFPLFIAMNKRHTKLAPTLDVYTHLLPESEPKSICVSGHRRWTKEEGCRNEVYCKASRLCFACFQATKHDRNEWKKRKAEAGHREFLRQADIHMDAPYFAANFDFLLEATGPEGYRFVPPPSALGIDAAHLRTLQAAARTLVEGLLRRQHEIHHSVHKERWIQDATRTEKLGPKMIYAEYSGQDSGSTNSASCTSATADQAFSSAQQLVLSYLEGKGATLRIHIWYVTSRYPTRNPI